MSDLPRESVDGVTYDPPHYDLLTTYNDGREVAHWNTQHVSGLDGYQRFIRCAEIQPEDTVLDIACGTGLAGVLACEVLEGRASQVYFVDTSMPMLIEAKR
jgi:ubiquinone/menaquinone biosynthesis C-methylase UbiE